MAKESKRSIQHVAVLGANGAMGYGGAAQFTKACRRVTFLARTKEKARQGLESAIEQVRSTSLKDRSEIGSYDDDFERIVGEADLIFESIAEDFDLKKEFFERIDACRRDDSIVATVTSGLSINQLSTDYSESLQRNFLGLHLFNPPNVIMGTELVAGSKTDPSLVDTVEKWCIEELGRVVVRTTDSPGFAGNRIGFKVMNEVAQLAEELGVLQVDRIAGPYTGRMMTLFETVDLVGWDVHKAIVDNIYQNAPDEAQETLKLPRFMDELVTMGTMGDKSGGGFYKKTNGEDRLVLDPKTKDYIPEAACKLPDLSYIDEVAKHYRFGDYEGGMAAFLAAKSDEAALARKIMAGYISYAFHRAGQVTDSITGIDLIMAYGFNWAPPSVLVDTIGLSKTVEMIERAGVPIPPILIDTLNKGRIKPFFNHPNLNRYRYLVAS